MSAHTHHFSAIFQILLIAWLFCSNSIVLGQSTEIRPPAPAYSPEPLPPVPAPSQYRPPSLRKSRFEHARAADALRILQQLTGEYSSGIAVDERTNSLIYLADDEDARELEELCNVLDTETPTPGDTGLGVSISIPALGPTPKQQSQMFSFSIGFERGESVDTLMQRYNELEQQAHQLADKCKQSKSLSESQRSELQLAVRKSFEARQALQRAELGDLAGRMKSMQQSIEMRDKLADKVVERRVEDLLDPNLKWDAGQLSEQLLTGPNQGSSNPAMPLPPSPVPSNVSVPYVPGEPPATVIRKRIQGRWIVQTHSDGNKDGLADLAGQLELDIEGNSMRYLVGEQEMTGQIFLADCKELESSSLREDGPLPIDFIYDPNGDPQTMRGIIACDGTTLSICMARDEGNASNGFRPSLFVPGSKVTLVKCRRAPSNAANTSALDEIDLSTPQATLDYIHRFSIAHPDEFPAECYTDEAILELSGMMLQNLSMMSAISQIALQMGGVIGENERVPVISGASPAFHIQVDALLKEQMLPTPTESANKAFELLAKLTFASTSSNAASLVQTDRQLIRMAAGILKSPKEFLPAASKLLTAFGEHDADVTKSKEAAQTQPKADIAINGDEATATFISSDNDSSSSPLNAPRVTKLRRIDGRWLICEILTDEEILQMQSSMSQAIAEFSESDSEKAVSPDRAERKVPGSDDGASMTTPHQWNEFLQLLPESGTALVMFAYELETKTQMSPVAKKVAEAASVQFIELSQRKWNEIIAPPATHFVLMKDRQLVGTRTGLITESRLQDFVSKAKDWLTPQSTGVDENSLVRIDCFINPGTDNIGSQHGEAYPFTTAVVAVHEDQALLLGGEGIGEYIAKGYACVAIVRDASGKQKQVPLDVLLTGPVKLVARSDHTKKSAATASISFGDGDSKEIPLPFLDSIYPKSFTESLEAYDVGSAIYRISGAHGLTPVKLAAVNDPPKVDQRVLSGSFTRDQHFPPIHYFRSPLQWQSQTVSNAGGHIYGENINGAEMFEVLCPTGPAPCGFTFNEHGRFIGSYGLGEPSEKDMTHSVFKPDTTHSVLQAALQKIDDAGLKAALTQTLEESKTAAPTKDENSPAAGDAANASTSQPSTSPPAKFDTPQALLAHVDECTKSGSYEEFVMLFTDEGVRDLAGSLIVSAMQVTTVTILAKQNGGDLSQGPARIQEALNRWLQPNPTPEQQQAASEALSLMFLVGFGGPVQDKSVITAYVAGIRKNAERVTDFRKFSVDMLKAYHELTGEPFGYFGTEKDREWQVTQSADKAVVTLVMKTEPTPATVGIGSNIPEKSSTPNGPEPLPVMTLTNLDGTWRISSLFDELLNVVKPNIEAPSAAAAEQSNTKMITRRYSVGSFVTENFFVGKGNFDLKEVYEKYETDIEQSLEDLAKTVTATCTQPPKFVQVLSSSRCLLIGHTEAGHQEIANFMGDIGINNDRIRLRGVVIEITKDEAKSLGIELTQRVLSPEEGEKLREFQKDKKPESEISSQEFNFVAMDETIQSGTQTHVKTTTFGLQFPFAARIVPGTKEVQMRMDFHGASGGVEFFAPRIQTLSDGKSVLLEFGDDCYWLATADIVHDASPGANQTDNANANAATPSTPAIKMQ